MCSVTLHIITFFSPRQSDIWCHIIWFYTSLNSSKLGHLFPFIYWLLVSNLCIFSQFYVNFFIFILENLYFSFSFIRSPCTLGILIFHQVANVFPETCFKICGIFCKTRSFKFLCSQIYHFLLLLLAGWRLRHPQKKREELAPLKHFVLKIWILSGIKNHTVGCYEIYSSDLYYLFYLYYLLSISLLLLRKICSELRRNFPEMRKGCSHSRLRKNLLWAEKQT